MSGDWHGNCLPVAERESDVPGLREALCSDNPSVRFWAARAVVELGPDAHPLTEDLIHLLCDSHHTVTDSVAWAIGSIGEAAIPQLIDAATGPDVELRSRAVLVLGRYPHNIKLKLPTVLNAMDDRESKVRQAAARVVFSLAQSSRSETTDYDDVTLATRKNAVHRITTDAFLGMPNWWAEIITWMSATWP